MARIAFMRNPARKATARNIGTRVKAVPRSGSAAMSTDMSAMAMPGPSRSRRPRLSFFDSANTLATNKAATSFANSEGWIWNPAITNQRLVPAMRGAKTSTAANAATAGT
jgi:hypothetical protein